jgi:5-oxoprolinase (ATP-hydrolysing) subunit A
MGESFGAWRMGDDEALLEIVTSANIACGFHAGDPSVMDATVKAALRHGVAIGAHPSYPDLAGFGRRSMKMTPGEIERAVLYQIGALAAFVRANGGKLIHVKPHGALYNDAARDRNLADAIAAAVKRFDATLVLVGLAGSALIDAAHASAVPSAAEGFCDRAYEPDGSLRPRERPGAVFADPRQAAAQAVALAKSGRMQTLCIHGDTPGAAAIARAVRAELEKAGIAVASLRAGHAGA